MTLHCHYLHIFTSVEIFAKRYFHIAVLVQQQRKLPGLLQPGQTEKDEPSRTFPPTCRAHQLRVRREAGQESGSAG